jgi:hypothetical protein
MLDSGPQAVTSLVKSVRGSGRRGDHVKRGVAIGRIFGKSAGAEAAAAAADVAWMAGVSECTSLRFRSRCDELQLSSL